MQADEAASRHAQSHLRRFAPVVWWGSLVEVHSAICRLHRDKEISDLHKQGAVARLRLLNRGWREILPDDQVRDLATQLLGTHSLRAADSLQLAASLIWCEQRPSKRSFICGDQRLAKAADSLGSRTLKSCPLNGISRLIFISSCNHRTSQRELVPLLFKDPVFLAARPTTSILIRARSVVQVHPGPPSQSPIITRLFSLFPFRGFPRKPDLSTICQLYDWSNGTTLRG
jgi:predicted nucleic acid-binding protein